METINPHSLLESEAKEIVINQSILNLYKYWKKLMQEKTDKGFSDEDAFIAGYFLGKNPMLCDKYKKSCEDKTEKYNSPYYNRKEINDNL